jgi:hypothetical protein
VRAGAIARVVVVARLMNGVPRLAYEKLFRIEMPAAGGRHPLFHHHLFYHHHLFRHHQRHRQQNAAWPLCNLSLLFLFLLRSCPLQHPKKTPLPR